MISAKIEGIPDLRRELAAIPAKLRKRALRTALAAGARVVRDEARRRAPIISASAPAVLKGYRKPGTLRQALAVRTSKIARRRGDVGVFVNVRPAKAGKRGARNPNDPFYWRWIEFGRAAADDVPFLQPAANKLGQALQVFKEKIVPAIAKLNNKGQTP